MAGLARSYVYYYHKEHNSAGHLWQGRFKSQPVQKELYLLSCGRYIERNPVKAGLVVQPENYSYSSAKFYIEGKDDGITTEDPLFSTFGNSAQERRKTYKEILERFDSEQDKEDEKAFESLMSAYGSAEFIKRLVIEKGLYLPNRAGRPRK